MKDSMFCTNERMRLCLYEEVRCASQPQSCFFIKIGLLKRHLLIRPQSLQDNNAHQKYQKPLTPQ